MKIFVMGATGSTGRYLVIQLLNRGIEVKAVVRSGEKLKNILALENTDGLEIIEGEVINMRGNELQIMLSDCDAAASCLGHNLTFKGMFANPRYLVRDSVRHVCETTLKQIREDYGPFKFVLMNTSANRNPDEQEGRNIGEILLFGLIRLLLPPHRDNEQAAEYLRCEVGRDNPRIEWAAIRPDNLIDKGFVTGYEIHPSPVRSPLFNPGKTSRINVAAFMARLLEDERAWSKWKGRMPVIYNEEA
ncbi:MAG: SDR family oxidoreductase [Spirochaetales bacterium]|nr:SDR family oxidoreductase [Spirochaetales bacterium]